MKGFVYCIKNTIDNNLYIGSTIEPIKRKNRHFRDLTNGNHCNVYLQRIFNKYGKDIFIFEILLEEEILDRQDLFILEKEYIEKYKPKYNIGSVSGGDNLTNHPLKEDIIKRRVETQLMNMSLLSVEERKEKYGRVKELNGNWKGGKTYCICGAIKASTAKTCIKCRNKTGENNPFFGKKHSDETKKKLSEANKGFLPVNSKKVIAEGNIFDSMAQAARHYNITSGAMHYRINSSSNKWKDFQYFQQ